MGYRNKEKKRQTVILFVLVLFLFCVICMIIERGRPNASAIKTEISGELAQELSKMYSPSLQFVKYAGKEEGFLAGISHQFARQLPLLAYVEDQSRESIVNEDNYMKDFIMQQEGSDEYYENTLYAAMEMENELHNINPELESGLEETDEGKIVVPQTFEFRKRTSKVQTYSESDLKDYAFVMENFYVVDADTGVNASTIAPEQFLKEDLSVNRDNSGIQILIYHTHSQEAFADSIPGDESTTIVGMGEYLKTLLEEEYGFSVMHHTGQYDVENRDYAYSKAAPAIETILSQHPEIEVIIDLHRDAVNENRRLVCDLDGRRTAQIMFFNGLCYTNALGEIDYLQNPYLKENLALSFRMQIAANEYYPGLTRRIYLRGYRYNMHYRPKTLLIELGAQTNTVEEARNACDPLAAILATILGER